MIKHIIETYDFTKNNITVRVEINHSENKISLLNPNGYKNYKEYIFAERGVEYMQGWINILEVMQDAIKDAKSRYEKQHAEISKFEEKQVNKLLKDLKS